MKTIRFVLIIALIPIIFACKCRYPPDKEMYCRSDFVARVEILEETAKADNVIEFKVKYMELYKATPRFNELEDKTKIYIKRLGTSCDVPVKYSAGGENVYLFGGQVNPDGQNFLKVCQHWYPLWSVVSNKLKTKLQNRSFNCASDETDNVDNE